MAEIPVVRLILADDHALVRAGLNSYLKADPSIQVVGEADDGEDALELCEMLRPDLAILDAHMPVLNGLAATQIICKRWRETAVLLLVDELSEAERQQAVESGAKGCLSKNISQPELLRVIHAARQDKPLAEEAPALQKSRSKGKKALAKAVPSQSNGMSRQEMMTELEAAGRIQAKILPENEPRLDGWDIAAALEPAYETSGDFYDFIPLAYGKLGIVMADVANKGLGAAIFMALCSSLMRTYATHFPIMPGMVMHSVNERLNADSRSGLFVTTFYGVLDPKIARLTYANAGHNPPVMVSDNKGKPMDLLTPTGPALGIFDQARWQQKLVRFAPGDVLLLYTDGVTEAQNERGEFFGDIRLKQLVRAHKDEPAEKIQKNLLNDLRRFTGDMPRADDVALIVIKRTGG